MSRWSAAEEDRHVSQQFMKKIYQKMRTNGLTGRGLFVMMTVAAFCLSRLHGGEIILSVLHKKPDPGKMIALRVIWGREMR